MGAVMGLAPETGPRSFPTAQQTPGVLAQASRAPLARSSSPAPPTRDQTLALASPSRHTQRPRPRPAPADSTRVRDAPRRPPAASPDPRAARRPGRSELAPAVRPQPAKNHPRIGISGATAEMGADCRYELAQAAYVKLALHALKHPATAVNGLLVGRLVEPSSSPAVVSVIDAVPLSHHPHHLPLLPTLELALTLVEDHFATQGEGLAVVGYYHANPRCDDTDLPPVAKRVGDHIFRYFPRSAVLLVDNKKLEEAVKGKSRDPVAQLYTRDSSKSWRQAGSDGSSQLVLKEPSTNVVLADHVTTKKWEKIVDFDDHLDDISKDWLNPGLLD